VTAGDVRASAIRHTRVSWAGTRKECAVSAMPCCARCACVACRTTGGGVVFTKYATVPLPESISSAQDAAPQAAHHLL